MSASNIAEVIGLTKSVNSSLPFSGNRTPRSPKSGPKILFFSGGTAIKGLSRSLINYSYNTIHIITPFDSGGSSATLRKAFNIMAVGDLRNRLLALGNPTNPHAKSIVDFLSIRFPCKADNFSLHKKLWRITCKDDSRLIGTPDSFQDAIERELSYFVEKMPCFFDLQNASIGNLFLSSCFIRHGNITKALKRLSDFVDARGVVIPVLTEPMHLVAELEDSRVLAGQHLITGKETAAIDAKISNLYLSKTLENPVPSSPAADKETKTSIAKADLICYPMGSFYSSVIANLLPSGVGTAIANSSAMKVYIPNTGKDPELFGMTIAESVKTLISYLRKDKPDAKVSELLNFVIIDSTKGEYQGGVDKKEIENLGVAVLDLQLAKLQQSSKLDENKLAPLLVLLANNNFGGLE